MAFLTDIERYDEPLPAVGIFWFDPQELCLFGVYKQPVNTKIIEAAAEKGLPFINYPKLHHNIWLKENFKAQIPRNDDETSEETSDETGTISRFSADYTQLARGRVSWVVNKFIVLVGNWAEEYEDELRRLIKQEFALPSFEFVYDEHWNVGRGWTE